MVNFNNEEILLGIKVHDISVLNYIYDKFYPRIKKFIKKNNGNNRDAEDIFQETIIIIYRNINEKDLILTCDFYTYFFTVCRNTWLKQLKKNKKRVDKYDIDDKEILEIDKNLDKLFIINEKHKLYQKHYKTLKNICQEVIRLSLQNIPLKIIATKTGFKNAETAKYKKHICLKELFSRIKADSAFLKIKNEN
ncbi:MAG: sigma-70 family RNA polymerase sigma factor [Bacteroidales bacterium]|nr:sigma-70 family RNA polymerase sigma factor [Bacteroidales bacterium]